MTNSSSSFQRPVIYTYIPACSTSDAKIYIIHNMMKEHVLYSTSNFLCILFPKSYSILHQNIIPTFHGGVWATWWNSRDRISSGAVKRFPSRKEPSSLNARGVYILIQSYVVQYSTSIIRAIFLAKVRRSGQDNYPENSPRNVTSRVN